MKATTNLAADESRKARAKIPCWELIMEARRYCTINGAAPNRSASLPLWLGAMALWLFTFTVCSQSYSIDRSKIAGGGGTSAGGGFTVSGTIGQLDAGGPLTNGQFALTGGFWSLINVVQTPNAPVLTITHAGNLIVVSWPASVTGWTLQTNQNLTTGLWGNYVGLVTNNRVTNSPSTGNLFFRLAQP